MDRPPLGQYVDRPDAFMPCCPNCGSAKVTPKDDEGLQDCLACGIWFDPCLREELDTYLAALEAKGEARVIRVKDLGKALEARHSGGMVMGYKDIPGRYHQAQHAAHLARVALGESS